MSEDRPVILKGVTVPVTIREWNGEREILDRFKDDARLMVRLHDDDWSERFMTRCVTVETPTSVLAIYACIDAKTSEIVQMDPPELWLIGVDTCVFAIDWQSGEIRHSIDLVLTFWEFHAFPDGRVLIRFELGVIMVDSTGREIWTYDGGDICVSLSIGADRLHLSFVEGAEVEIDLATGAEVRASDA